MKVSLNIYYLLIFSFYLTYYSIVGRHNILPVCKAPFSDDKCFETAFHTNYLCFIAIENRNRYFNCYNNSINDIMFVGTSFLFQYYPFTEFFFSKFSTKNHLKMTVNLEALDDLYRLDLRSLTQLKYSWNIELNIVLVDSSIYALIQIPESIKRQYQFRPEYKPQYISYNLSYNIENSAKNHKTLCYYLEYQDKNRIPVENKFLCPRDECSIDSDATRVCLSSTTCYLSGANTLICPLDRLKSTDRFSLLSSFVYDTLVITTNNTNINTLHKFSLDLLKRCVSYSLIIIVIHGQLDIPFFDSTLLSCPFGVENTIS